LNKFLPVSILLFLLLSASQVSAYKETNYLNQGNTAFLKGNLTDAMKLYSQAERSCVDVIDKVENNKALVFAKKGNYDLALKRLTKSIEHNPNNGNAYYNRGIIYLIKNDSEAAVADMKQAKFLGTRTEESVDYNIALAYYLAGSIEKAKTSLNAVSAETADSRIPYLKGLISYSERKFDDAAQAFGVAHDIERNEHIRYAYGLATYYSGRHEEGLAILQELKGKDEFKANYQSLIADLAYDANDLTTAKNAYLNVNKHYKKDATAWVGLGNIAMSENDYSTAANNYDTALKYDRQCVAALNGLSRIAFLDGRYKASVELYDKVLIAIPDDQKALYGKALSAMKMRDPYTCLDALAKINKQGLTAEQVEKVVLLEASALGICNKKEQAVKLLKKYRSSAQDKYKVKTLLAYYYLRMFQYGNAISSISISKYEDYLPYLIAGHASLHRGEHAGAYRYYRKAYKITPTNPDVLMGAALSMMEINMKREGKRVIDSLEILYPENYHVFNSKGIIYKDLGLGYKNKNQNDKAIAHFKIAAQAFERAITIRPSLKTSFDNNLGLCYYYLKELPRAINLFEGSSRLASINNRALIDISEGDFSKGIATLDSLNKDYIKKNKAANRRVKTNLELARRRAPMNNNYKFITYYFLHQDTPDISENNPFQSRSPIIKLPIDQQPDVNYILEYADIICEDENQNRKKKKKSNPKLKFFKKKDKSKCPTFKT